MRQPISLDRRLTPLFSLGGINPKTAWVDVEDGQLTVSMGPLGQARIACDRIANARVDSWPVSRGFGVGVLALRRQARFVGTPEGVVEINLAKPRAVLAGMPAWVTRMAVSVPDPDRLVKDLSNPTPRSSRAGSPLRAKRPSPQG